MERLIVSLGDTDEEKYINIKLIKSFQKYFRIMAILIVVISGIFLIRATLSGVMQVEGLGVVGTILFLVIFLAISYWGIIHVYGNMFGWGMFVMFNKDFEKYLPGEGFSSDIVSIYCFDGEVFVDSGDGSFIATVIKIIIVFGIGIWLGIFNWIIHFKDWIEVPKKIKKKYKKRIKDEKHQN